MSKILKKKALNMREFLLLFSGTMIITTLFITSPQLHEGILIAKEQWFRYAMAGFCLIAFFVLLSDKKKIIPPFKLTDAIVIIFAIWIVITYDFRLNPDPGRLGWVLLLAVLWFFLRAIFARYENLINIFVYVLIVSSLCESLIGLGQLYGLLDPFHGKSRITGSFFNPGPYAGYIALFFPLALSNLLKEYKQTKTLCFSNISIWICAFTLLLALLVLPASMSRSAWIALLLPSLILLAGYLHWLDYWRRLKISKFTKIALIVAIISAIIAGGAGIYIMKKDSADGRVFIWKQSVGVIEKKLFTGVGLGGFAPAYGDVQSDYFVSGVALQQEEKVAGCPQHAFNEYLQVAAETGLPGLLFFAALLLLSICNCVKGKKWGIAASLLAFMLFAFSSYPLLLIPFPVALTFLLVIAQTGVTTENVTCPHARGLLYFCFLGLLLVAAISIGVWQKDYYKHYKQWSAIRQFYQSADYVQAAQEYSALAENLHYQPLFVYEYAHSLFKTERYAESNKQLESLTQLSCDPMIFNEMGLNYQALGEYEKAEESFLNALYLLPGRLYPYYLLAKLYAVPEFYNPGKMKEMAQAVLNKEAKVNSTAVQEMKDEMEKLLNKQSCNK